jgi:chromosome segregation ATPase
MQDLVLDGEAFSISIGPLLTNCRLFQENRVLFAQPNYDVQSRVSVDSFRTFVGAIGGTEPDITDGNASDLELLKVTIKGGRRRARGRRSASSAASPSGFSTGPTPGGSTSTMLSDEHHHSAGRPLNSHLESENRILKLHLSKAMQFSNDLDELNSKHAQLANQLRDSEQRTENFQQRLRLSQQKNQDLTKRIGDLELSLKIIARERDELHIQFQEQGESSKNLQKVIDQYDLERRTFFASCPSLFGMRSNGFPQILETFQRQTVLNSGKAKAALTNAEKEKIEIHRALDAAVAQLEKAQKQTSTLKRRALNTNDR